MSLFTSILGSGPAPSPLLQGLVSFWKLDEASGNRLDSIGTNHLVPTATPAQVTGRLGNACGFISASVQSLAVNSNSGLQVGGATNYEIGVWIKLTSYQNEDFISKYNGGITSREYSLYYDLTNKSFAWRVSPVGGGAGVLDVRANPSALPATMPSLDTWYFVSAWQDSTNGLIGISVNGGTPVTLAYTLGTFNGTSSVTFGLSRSSGHLNGAMQRAYFYKGRILTQAERLAWFNAGSGLDSPTSAASLTITSPSAYRVFQRSGTTGTIPISGTYRGASADIEARFNSGSWVTIASGVSGAFSGSLTAQAQGQGLCEVRVVGQPLTTRSFEFVGIGDVFIVAGQSNASGRGTSVQVYAGTPKPSIFANDYLWKELKDPTDSAAGQVDAISDDTAFVPIGSVWPLLATPFLSSTGVPIAFVPCPLGGVSITSFLPGANHQDRATLYGSMIYRALQTGCKAVLWWQGETDAKTAMSTVTYEGHLNTLANAVFADLGVKLVPAKLQACTTAWCTAPQLASIQTAIGNVWAGNANVIGGVDLSSVGVAADGVHLISNAHLASAATIWWNGLKAAFGYP